MTIWKRPTKLDCFALGVFATVAFIGTCIGKTPNAMIRTWIPEPVKLAVTDMSGNGHAKFDDWPQGESKVVDASADHRSKVVDSGVEH